METLANWKEPQLECHGPSDEEILKSFDTEEGKKFSTYFNELSDRVAEAIETDVCKCERKKKFTEFLTDVYTKGGVNLNDTVAKIKHIQKLQGGQSNVSWPGMHRDTIEKQNEMILRVLEHEYLIDQDQMEYGVDYVLC